MKAAPVGLEGRELERMLEEVLAVPEREQQAENAETRRRRIAAVIACHAAIKVNMPLEPAKIDWLLTELGKDGASDELSAWPADRIAVFS